MYKDYSQKALVKNEREELLFVLTCTCSLKTNPEVNLVLISRSPSWISRDTEAVQSFLKAIFSTTAGYQDESTRNNHKTVTCMMNWEKKMHMVEDCFVPILCHHLILAQHLHTCSCTVFAGQEQNHIKFARCISTYYL